MHLNTDLEVSSESDLSGLVNAFGEEVVVLYHGEAFGHRRASFELVDIVNICGANEIISHFCSMVESFSEESREIWDSAFKKTFDIGCEAETSPESYSSEIQQTTIEQMAALGASITITVYPPGYGSKG